MLWAMLYLGTPRVLFFYARDRIQNLHTYILHIYASDCPASFASHTDATEAQQSAPLEHPIHPPQYPHQLHTIAPGHQQEGRATPHHISHPQYHQGTLRCLDAQNQIWKKENCKTSDISLSILNLHPHVAASAPGTSAEYCTHATEPG
jgi:hypothetical protein